MPNYTALDKTSGEEFDVTMSWDEFQTFLRENENLEQVFKMNLAYRIGRLPVSETWRSRLRDMKKANPRSTIEIP